MTRTVGSIRTRTIWSTALRTNANRARTTWLEPVLAGPWGGLEGLNRTGLRGWRKGKAAAAAAAVDGDGVGRQNRRDGRWQHMAEKKAGLVAVAADGGGQ